MSSYMDPFDLLVQANPIPSLEALAPTRSYVPAQRTLQRIVRTRLPEVEASPGGPGRRWRPRTVALAAAGVVLASVAAAGAWVVTRPATNTTRVACYAAASLDAATAEASLSGGLSPADACAPVWEAGTFPGGVPPLAACVLPSGVIGVFPGDEAVCDRLDLARLATDSGGTDTLRVVRLVDTLTRELAAPNCLEVTAAEKLVRERLDQLDLTGWILIAPASNEQGRPCTSIAIDPPVKTIRLVPIPAPSAS